MPEGNEDGGSESSGDDFNVKVKWVMPQRLDFMTFVGKDVLAVAHDIYIMFFNFKTNMEQVYVANNEAAGDGVDVIAGHRSNIFAFAEKVKNARIMIMLYPSFRLLAEMKDMDVNRYKGLCMMENDLVAGFSGFPNYLLSVWNWRTNQKLISVQTGVVRRSQLYMASLTHMLVSQCWGEGLCVWEVAQCYRRTFLLRRAKPESARWELPEPKLLATCWTLEGHLYAVDADANLYIMVSDGIDMVAQPEWSPEATGDSRPLICAFHSGLLLYGPDRKIRSLKKSGSIWSVAATLEPEGEVARLLADAAGDGAAAWTAAGLVYRLAGDSEDRLEMTPVMYKQRDVMKIQMIAPDFQYLATINTTGVLCIYEIASGKLVLLKHVDASDVSFEASPTEPVLAVTGCKGQSYGLALYSVQADGPELTRVARVALTHQIVQRVVFSASGRELMVAAMSAGHIFVYKLSPDYKLTLVRYAEVGRGLADCFLMKVGNAMRAFGLVLFSDKFNIGERIICINAETGKDNKVAGKMQGPYCRLLALAGPACAAAVPHLGRALHLLLLAADKGVTLSVKMGPIIESYHDMKQFDGLYTPAALLTHGYDGNVIIRKPDGSDGYELKLSVSHRYELGVRSVSVDARARTLAHVARNRTCALVALRGLAAGSAPAPLAERLVHACDSIDVIAEDDKNYLELQEERKVQEEAIEFRKQREEVVRGFEGVRGRVVALLEENIAERPLHQLSLAEFNLHLEHKKERNKAAEREREQLRAATEARIRAQDAVTGWVRRRCWDCVLTPRAKLRAIFSHYQVENYAVLPSQREKWPELSLGEALRAIEMDGGEPFRPWEEDVPLSSGDPPSLTEVAESPQPAPTPPQPLALAASGAHRCVPLPAGAVPQTLAYSFLHMNWMQQFTKLTVQNMRLWFNKQFDDLMNQKKREVGLVEERNARLRFIISELNKLSDLRGSFHHLTIEIQDPQWTQEEQPEKLIKVDPAECSIEPYISPSQVVVIPPDPGPKDDFRERALIEMMDGVLEKLWHEEIKKPIPMPQCMLDKDPEHFNEEDLRQVFEYEAKVAFRNQERDKYRKMLHAEYAKLAAVLNEGVVKFNMKVKEMWLTKLKCDSVIGQENLSLMRLRRTNLDRVEMAEKLEDMRAVISRNTAEVETLTAELHAMQEQAAECQNTYEQLAAKDKHLERTFKNHFVDLSPIVVDQCYKFFKKRPKWQARGALPPAALYELAAAALSGVRPPLLHQDCVDFFKGLEQLDQASNMPAVMDEGLWAAMCRLRRAKIENEVRMRGVVQELAHVESGAAAWRAAVAARRARLASGAGGGARLRRAVELAARNRTLQLVLPAGQVEITTSGHIEDFEDATLILREDIEKINDLILKVGAMKLRMMRAQMEFRKGILAKEWEHAQMAMRLRHMRQELYSYTRLKIPKELQQYLKNKELGWTEEQEFQRMEKEMEASRAALDRALEEEMHRMEELQLKVSGVETQASSLEKLIASLNVKVSEKRLHEDPLEPIRIRRIFKRRMETLVMRSQLIRCVQANHTQIVLLQTELELLRLKTYPTLASFRTFT